MSEKGRRRLWEVKHPGSYYQEDFQTNPNDSNPSNEDDISEAGNSEIVSNESSSFARRTTQVQSLTGTMTDVFQIVGEFSRGPEKKILVSSKIERLAIEKLEANSFRLTVALHWTLNKFQFRLGLGVQYFTLTGKDLDGENVSEAGTLPATDIAFYWII